MFNTFLLKMSTGIAGGGFALAGDMGMAASYGDSVEEPSSPAECLVRVLLNTDGSWSIMGSTPASLGNQLLASGLWGTKSIVGIGVDYEASITINSGSVSSNMTSSYHSLSIQRYVDLLATDTSLNNGPVNEAANITLNIRKIGSTSPVLSETIDITSSADYTNV